MLDALECDGLVQQNAESPPLYLPGASLQRIKLVDILRSARSAEDDGRSDGLDSDTFVAEFLRELDREIDSHIGEESLVDFLKKFEDDSGHEDSLV